MLNGVNTFLIGLIVVGVIVNIIAFVDYYHRMHRRGNA